MQCAPYLLHAGLWGLCPGDERDLRERARSMLAHRRHCYRNRCASAVMLVVVEKFTSRLLCGWLHGHRDGGVDHDCYERHRATTVGRARFSSSSCSFAVAGDSPPSTVPESKNVSSAVLHSLSLSHVPMPCGSQTRRAFGTGRWERSGFFPVGFIKSAL